MKPEINWWDDPKNHDEIQRISWWNHSDKKETINFPFAIVQDGEWWVASTNDDTKKLLGEWLHGCSQGKTKQEAIDRMFQIIRITHEFSKDKELSYERWVPLIVGPWGKIGGHWFSIFGINVSFRYGKGMKGGWYIPLTKLNISMYSHWTTYKNWKKERKQEALS